MIPVGGWERPFCVTFFPFSHRTYLRGSRVIITITTTGGGNNNNNNERPKRGRPQRSLAVHSQRSRHGSTASFAYDRSLEYDARQEPLFLRLQNLLDL